MELSYIGVSEKKEKQFRSKGITCVEDLIRFVPFRYDDFTKETGIRDEGTSCVTALCAGVRFVNSRTPFIEAECRMDDGTVIRCNWFRQDYMYQGIRALAGQRV